MKRMFSLSGPPVKHVAAVGDTSSGIHIIYINKRAMCRSVFNFQFLLPCWMRLLGAAASVSTRLHVLMIEENNLSVISVCGVLQHLKHQDAVNQTTCRCVYSKENVFKNDRLTHRKETEQKNDC